MAEQVSKILSASRLKTLETCSWSYWCNYHLKLPQKQNEGAQRGTVCHLAFEMLVKPKHKKHYNKIVKGNSIEASPAVYRMVMRNLIKMEKESDLPMTNDENVNLVKDMIMVGLKFDFFGWGGKVENPELEFLLEKDNPEYKVRGFIDKPIVYKRSKKVKIVDYKSSKYKFRGEELTANVQAMIYTLAAKKYWPDYKPTAEFLFLRFPKKPAQQVEFNEYQLEGFEHYLSFAYAQINNFTEVNAKSNYAADSKKNAWLCKIGKWRCPYIDGYDYYSLIDSEGKQIASNFKKDLLTADTKKGEKIEKKHYEGCPRHKKNDNEDPFCLT